MEVSVKREELEDNEKEKTPSPLIKDDDDEVQQQSEYDAVYDDPSAEKEKKEVESKE